MVESVLLWRVGEKKTRRDSTLFFVEILIRPVQMASNGESAFKPFILPRLFFCSLTARILIAYI